MAGKSAWKSRRGDSFRRLVFATYGDVCHICHHGGARQVDHVQSQTEHPELEFVLSNCRPAHGTFNQCKTCGQFCNQLRGGYSLERAQRLIAERTRRPERKTPPKPDSQSGRDW